MSTRKNSFEQLQDDLSKWIDKRMRIKNINVAILLVISIKIGQVLWDYKDQFANLDIFNGQLAGMIVLGIAWVFFTVNAVLTWHQELKAISKEIDVQEAKNLLKPKTVQQQMKKALNEIKAMAGELTSTIEDANELILAVNTNDNDQKINVPSSKEFSQSELNDEADKLARIKQLEDEIAQYKNKESD